MVFRTFTSCQGSSEYSISAFTALVVLQCLLLLPKFGDPYAENDDSCDTTGSSTTRQLDNDQDMIPAKKFSSNFGITERGYSHSYGFVGITCEKPSSNGSSRDVSSHYSRGSSYRYRMPNRHARSEGYIRDLNTLGTNCGGSVRSNENQSVPHGNPAAPNEADDQKSEECQPKTSTCSVWLGSLPICWNSLWMLLYHLVIFMGIHATLLASRIHGSIALNKHALETCTHLRDKFPLGMWSPRLGYPLISESTFFLTYMSCTTFELITRKSSDASYLSNFFSRHFFKERLWIGIVRSLLQFVIFFYAFFLEISSILNGYGSPMQIVCGFSMGMLMLWINALLTQLLQLSDMSTSTMNLNWFWSLLSLLNFWICSVLFYISVYGLPLTAPYMYLQVASWIPLLLLTTQKGKQIFMWQDISYALYAFN
ncbi:uncharacterized protein BXIN_1989 [Babesia sp. Xinjiang]|uniref:uncharacterized protein n=1 Tax=Babesia sp. Xinjiang TaxID=462227 RepID=UPI000A2597B6|nr:uncharacterized protein BXIN_1989 [Babesia sp. Xinjiang]ORM40364.1 hypothetical protein BXIN_1989 [Babesia sp. Xinjiang]